MKKYLFKIGIVFLILFPLILLGTFYDYEITYKLSEIYYDGHKYIYTPQAWIVPVELISSTPTMILLAVCSNLTYIYIKKCLESNQKLKYCGWFMITFSALTIFRLCYTLTTEFTKNYELSLIWLVGIGIISIFLFLLLCYFLNKIKTDILKSIIDLVIITLCVGFVIFGVMAVIKFTWGRPRLRNLIDEGNMQGYLPWYKPMFFSGYASFPSGHATKAGYVFILSIWFRDNEKAKKIFNAIAWIFVTIACGARLMQAEHYLTDVVFGTFITYAIIQFFIYLYYSKWMEKCIKLVKKFFDVKEKELEPSRRD
ncbi:MAG: phosphatase PAP2 family protein [Lachnospiraceae bacterium]|nr:phosphatase PAP2 family protein [Lachnospiraceae bacterium]